MKNEKVILITFVIIITALCRFLPHPPNFTPVIALGILSVTLFKSRLSQFGLPLLIMFFTDLFLGFHSLIPFVYTGIALAGLTGYILKKQSSIINGIGCSLLSSIIFFVVSNFGVWITSSFYAKSLTGLISCYIAAIPFFHNTVLSTSLIVIGILYLEKYFFKHTLKNKTYLRTNH